MFEVRQRAATTRLAQWTNDDVKVQTPLVLYPDSQHLESPDFADAVLGKDEAGSHIAVHNKRVQLPDYFGVPAGHVSEECVPGAIKSEGAVALLWPGAENSDLSAIHHETDLLILENSLELFQNPRLFVETVVRIRQLAGYQRALYLPGVALPSNLAVLVYAGADVLDAARVYMLSRRGQFLTSDGHWDADEVDFSTCVCTACRDYDTEYERVLNHNLLAMNNELHQIKMRIAKGNFREFVEYRAKTSPELVAMIRHLDHGYMDFQETRFPVTGREFRATTRLSLNRPDVVRFRNRVLSRYWKPEDTDILVLLPCSARKPYSQSKSHRKFKNVIKNSGKAFRVHEVIVTSPLGLVPRELELAYPAAHYDIPVTGHWYAEERKMINTLLSEYLAINKYDYIFDHMEEGLLDVPGAIRTCKDGRPSSDRSLRALEEALANTDDAAAGTNWKKRTIDEFNNMARFQWGEKAGGIFDRCAIKGRYPLMKVFEGKTQLAMLSERTGQLIPTPALGQKLAERGLYAVVIYDFEITGNLFAVGVEAADENIRVGDEVIVISEAGLKALGTAKMNADEMVESNKGEAVRVRHKIKN